MTPSKALIIDLDCLLDTRLGVIKQNASEEAYRLISNDPGYWYRDIEEWDRFSHEKITNDDVAAWYAKRDKTTLQISVMTNIFLYLEAILQTHYETIQNGTDTQPLQMTINLNPYELDEEETKGLVDSIKYNLSYYEEIFTVSTVRLPMLSLEPHELAKSYGIYITYEVDGLLSYYQKQLLERKAYTLTLTGPLLFQKEAEEYSLKERQQEVSQTRFILREFVDVDLIDPFWFSQVIPDDLSKKVEEMRKKKKKSDKHYQRNVKSFSTRR